MAIDPGTTQSAVLIYEPGRPLLYHAIMPNQKLLEWLRVSAWDLSSQGHTVAIEMIDSYGMAVGAEIFETCVWIGRFTEAARPMRVERVFRRQVKMHLCASPRAKDPNIRQALIDKVGPKGSSQAPGPTYGITSHLWAALGVAVTFAETRA